jgi:hypothetical protein
MSRRGLLIATGVGAGVVATGAVAGLIATRVGSGRSAEPVLVPEPGPDVRALFDGIERVDTWTVRRVYGVYLGAIPVVLQADGGEPYQVDVLRRHPAGVAGVANTPSLSLFIANRGDGVSATDETHGLGAMALAEALAERERAGVAVPAALMTLSERQQTYPDAAFSVSV